MRIKCTAVGRFDGDSLTVGTVYNCEPVDEGTAAQNHAFHALLQELYRSGLYSYDADDLEDLKNFIKRDYGAGFESYVFVIQGNGGYEWAEVKAGQEWPDNIAKDRYGHRMVKGKLKSWADYSKKERQNAIDGLIAYCDNVGLCSRKYQEILRGMQK